jgi:hypothetical protein
VEVDYCTECDAQPWFRWSGTAYELGLHATGDTVLVGEGRGTRLFVLPRASAPARGFVQSCSEARVHEVAGRSGARWYFVETTALPRVRGWIAAGAVAAADDCD